MTTLLFFRLLLVSTLLSALCSCRSAPAPGPGQSLNAYKQAPGPDSLSKDTLLKFPARPEAGFHFEYLVYLPKGVKLSAAPVYLLVETNNSGLNDTMAVQEKGARYAAARSSVGNYVARKLRIPLLVPIFPRPASSWQVYTHALDRDALLSTQPDLQRLDLQLLAMVEDARKQLAQRQIRLQDKFFITGFSASGTFANRFSLLHPEVLKATAAGGINALAILPVAAWQGKELQYPLGISDVKTITGREVNLRAFQALPKLLYMGAQDDNDAAAFDDAYSEAERQLIYTLMGRQLVPERWQFMEQVYRQQNVQAEFKTYPHIGHGTDRQINNDLVEFFRKYTN